MHDRVETKEEWPIIKHCSMCLADPNVTCPRDCDATCLHCGGEFCGAHIGEHLNKVHCVALTLDHCSR